MGDSFSRSAGRKIRKLCLSRNITFYLLSRLFTREYFHDLTCCLIFMYNFAKHRHAKLCRLIIPYEMKTQSSIKAAATTDAINMGRSQAIIELSKNDS